MAELKQVSNQSNRLAVILFTGGPRIEHDVVKFAVRLDQDPDIELLAIFSESPSRGFSGVTSDLWRRRGVLAIPLLLLTLIRPLGTAIRHPMMTFRLSHAFRRVRPRIFFVPDLHATGVIERIRDLQPALGLVYGGPIIKPSIFNLPRFGTLGIHHGKVPEYRGKKTTFWAMYNGEEEVGVTIQRISSRLDGGDVLRAGRVKVGKRLPARVKQRLHELGLDLYMEGIHAVREGTAEFFTHGGQASTLYRDPGARDILGFWLRYMVRVLNFRSKARRDHG
jgi:hypothetical protein